MTDGALSVEHHLGRLLRIMDRLKVDLENVFVGEK